MPERGVGPLDLEIPGAGVTVVVNLLIMGSGN